MCYFVKLYSEVSVKVTGESSSSRMPVYRQKINFGRNFVHNENLEAVNNLILEFLKYQIIPENIKSCLKMLNRYPY